MIHQLRPPILIILPVLAVLGWASVVLHQSLESERLVEKGRQEKAMRTSAFAVVDELGSELFTMYSAFSYDLMVQRDTGAPVNKQTLSDAVFRYRAQARFPELLQGLVCLVRAPSGFEYAQWTERGWVTGQRPEWAPDLTPVNTPRRSQTAFSLEKPVLTLVLRGGREVSGEVVAVALRFSRSAVLEQVVPSLVLQQFSNLPGKQDYRAAVHNRDLPPLDTALPVDWEVPLLPSTSFDGWFDYYVNRLKILDRASLNQALGSQLSSEGTGWFLSVTRLPSGLRQEMADLQLRNGALALGFFLVLSLGFLGLYRVARQASRRAGEERTFLALVSHELKTPLAVVRSLAENLAQGVGTSEARAREYGRVLLEESDRLSRMVGNVLALTAIQGGFRRRDLERVDLETIVRERAGREPVSDVELAVQIHPGLPPVWGQVQALSAAVDNLVSNAFRHGLAGPGPHVIRLVLEPKVRRNQRGVVFVVEDNGPGFTWFEGRSFVRPFRKGRRAREDQRPGGGVGLSLVRTTALAMGGALYWKSKPQQGTKFFLWLREAYGE